MTFSQGNIVLVDLNPVKGHEQGNMRPVLVVNRDDILLPGGVNIILPITSHKKSHALEIELDNRTKTQGVILCFQARTVDLTARNAQVVEQIPEDILAVCCGYLSQLVSNTKK